MAQVMVQRSASPASTPNEPSIHQQSFNHSPLSQLYVQPYQTVAQPHIQPVNQSYYQPDYQSFTQLHINTNDLLLPPVTKRLRVDTSKANVPMSYAFLNQPRVVHYGSYSVPNTPQSNHLSVYQWPQQQPISPECSISPLTISVTPAATPQRHNSPINQSMVDQSMIDQSPIDESVILMPPQPMNLSTHESAVDVESEGTLLVPSHIDNRMVDDRMIGHSPASAPPTQSLEPRTPEAPCRRVREDNDYQSIDQPMPLDEVSGDFSNSVQQSIDRSSSQSSINQPNAQSINLNLDREFAPAAPLSEMLATVSMVLHVQLVKAVNEQSTTQSTTQPDKLAKFTEECPNYFQAGHPVFGTMKPDQPNNQLLSVRELYSFLLYVFQKGKFESDFALIMLIYFHRTLAYNQPINLTLSNWRPLLMTCLLLAQKMFDDSPLINTDFRYLYPYLVDRSKYRNQSPTQATQSTTQAIQEKMAFAGKFNRLEMELCQLIDWNLTVDEPTYLLYRRELAAIWKEYDTRQKQSTAQPTAQPVSQPVSQPVNQSSVQPAKQVVKPPQGIPQTARAPHRKLEIPSIHQSIDESTPHPWISPSSGSSAGHTNRKRKSSLGDVDPPHYFLRSNNPPTTQQLIGSGSLQARPINQPLHKIKETGHRRRHSTAR